MSYINHVICPKIPETKTLIILYLLFIVVFYAILNTIYPFKNGASCGESYFLMLLNSLSHNSFMRYTFLTVAFDDLLLFILSQSLCIGTL